MTRPPRVSTRYLLVYVGIISGAAGFCCGELSADWRMAAEKEAVLEVLDEANVAIVDAREAAMADFKQGCWLKWGGKRIPM